MQRFKRISHLNGLKCQGQQKLWTKGQMDRLTYGNHRLYHTLTEQVQQKIDMNDRRKVSYIPLSKD